MGSLETRHGIEQGNPHRWSIHFCTRRHVLSRKNGRSLGSTEVPVDPHSELFVSRSSSLIYCVIRDENIVIIGSGSAVHNLRTLWAYAQRPSPQFVIDFDKEMEKYACDLTVRWKQGQKICGAGLPDYLVLGWCSQKSFDHALQSSRFPCKPSNSWGKCVTIYSSSHTLADTFLHSTWYLSTLL